MAGAREAAKASKRLSIIGLIIGLVVEVILVVLLVLVFVVWLG